MDTSLESLCVRSQIQVKVVLFLHMIDKFLLAIEDFFTFNTLIHEGDLGPLQVDVALVVACLDDVLVQVLTVFVDKATDFTSSILVPLLYFLRIFAEYFSMTGPSFLELRVKMPGD